MYVAYIGRRMIRGQIIKFLFLLHSLGVFLMLVVPALWHAITSYSQIGFLGLRYDPNWISVNIYGPQVSVVYVYAFTTAGFVLASRLFVRRRSNLDITTRDQAAPKYLLMTVLFALSWVFFTQYYGNFGAILLLRTRETVDLPLYFELLRGSAIALCTYTLVVLTNIRFTRQPIGFAITIILFFFSLAIIVGFGTRNLLVYPITAVILALMLRRDQGLFRRNVIFAGLLLMLFLIVSVVLSNFRDAGVGTESNTAVDFSKLFLALDQFNALYVVFETTDGFVRPYARMPLSMLSDMFIYFVPSSLLQSFGIEKFNNINWQEWNAHLVGSIRGNVTPSYVGQAMVEEGLVGVILLPVVMTLMLLILLKIVDLKISRNQDSLEWMTIIALAGGILFNSVRMLSGIYMLYFVVFWGAIVLVRFARLFLKSSRLK